MGFEYKDTIQDSIIHYYDHVLLYNEYTDDVLEELDHVYAKAAKADEYEANLKEVKKQLKIKIRHARRDGDFSEAYAFSEALEIIENLI